MAHVQVFKGGTPVIKYGVGAGEPVEYTFPFGRNSLGGNRHWDEPFNQPPFDAHFNGAAGQVTYPAGCPLAPRRLRWQFDNLKQARLAADDVIDMILVPVNHWIDYVRFDVVEADPQLAGATVIVTGTRATVDPADPDRLCVLAEDPTFIAAQAAQGITDIPLDVPSSTFFSMVQLVAGDVQGTANTSTGVLTVTSSTGYISPYYIPPEFVTVGARLQRYQTGGLLLGIKILTVPTDTNVSVHNARHDFYLTTRVTGFESPAVI